MTRVGACAVAVLSVSLAVGCGSSTDHRVSAHVRPSASPSPSPSATTITLRPILEIKRGSRYAPNYAVAKGNCHGINGNEDYHVGAGVTLYGANGDVVGTGFVTSSRVIAGDCYLTGTVDDAVPAAYYKVQFANGNEIAFSRADIESGSSLTVIG